MTDLLSMHCQTGKVDSAPFSQTQCNQFLTQLPIWQIKSIDNIKQISRVFLLKNFNLAMILSNEVAELAEHNNHHPSISIEWGKVTVTWWTHSIAGLHLNDFIMAAKTEDLFNHMNE